jgi:hypothetical protein
MNVVCDATGGVVGGNIARGWCCATFTASAA